MFCAFVCVHGYLFILFVSCQQLTEMIRNFRRKSTTCAGVRKSSNVAQRSLSCYNFRREFPEGSQSDTDASRQQPAGSSFKTFGTFESNIASLRRKQSLDRSQDIGQLTAADRHIIEYLTHHYQKEFVSFPPESHQILSEDEEDSASCSNKQDNDDKQPPFITSWYLIGPTAWCLVLLMAVFTSDVLLAVRYYHKKQFYLSAYSVLIPHLVCAVFVIERLHYMMFKTTESSFFLKTVACIWYIITSPMLRMLPVLTLMSSSFDKVLMLTGDPTDTTEFIQRQEFNAFNDLVWICVLHCFPMAALQLNTLLFTKKSKEDTQLMVFQLVSICSCILLSTLVATFYLQFIGRCPQKRERTYSNPTQHLLHEEPNSKDSAQPTSVVFMKTAAWFFAITSRVLTVSLLILILPAPYAIIIAILIHIPYMAFYRCLSSNIGWSAYDVLSVGTFSSLFLLGYCRLGAVQEQLEQLKASVVYLLVSAVELAGVLVTLAFISRGLSIRLVVDCTLIQGCLLSMAMVMFLLAHRLSATKYFSPSIA